MTEDEKRQQKAMLLLEYQEAQDHVAALAEKATRVANNLNLITGVLRQAGQPGVGGFHGTAENKGYVRAGGEFREAMNYEALIGLIQELESAHKKVSDLRERKTSLGLK